MMKYLLTDSRVKKALSSGKQHKWCFLIGSDQIIRNHAQNISITYLISLVLFTCVACFLFVRPGFVI